MVDQGSAAAGNLGLAPAVRVRFNCGKYGIKGFIATQLDLRDIDRCMPGWQRQPLSYRAIVGHRRHRANDGRRLARQWHLAPQLVLASFTRDLVPGYQLFDTARLFNSYYEAGARHAPDTRNDHHGAKPYRCIDAAIEWRRGMTPYARW